MEEDGGGEDEDVRECMWMVDHLSEAGTGVCGGDGGGGEAGAGRHPVLIVSGFSVCEVLAGLVQRCMATSSCANVVFHSQVLCLVALVPRQDAHIMGPAFWRTLLQHLRALLPLIHRASCAGSPVTASDAAAGGSSGGGAAGAGVGSGENRVWMAQLHAALVLRVQTAAERSAAAAGVGAGVGMHIQRGESVLEMAGSVAYLRRAALAALSVCVDVVGSEVRPYATEIIQIVRMHMAEEMAVCLHVLRAAVSCLFACPPRHAARSQAAGSHRASEGSASGALGTLGAVRSGGGDAGATFKGNWGRAQAPFVDNIFDLAKGVVGEALRCAKSSHDAAVLEAAAGVTEAVLGSSLHYQLWDSVDRFLIFVTSQLKSEPLQLPRPRRLIARCLALFGHLICFVCVCGGGGGGGGGGGDPAAWVGVYTCIHVCACAHHAAFVCVYAWMYLSMYVCMYLFFIYSSICLSVYLSICLPTYLSTYLSVYRSIYVYARRQESKCA